MFTGGPAQYTLGHPHSRSVVSGSAGWERRHGQTVPKYSKLMNKGGITARSRPVHSPGGNVSVWGYSGAGSYQCSGPVMFWGRYREMDIHAGGVGCALARRVAETV